MVRAAGAGEARDLVVPGEVARFATGYGLGELIDVRREIPEKAAIKGFGLAALLFLGLLTTSGLAEPLSAFSLLYSVLRLIALLFFFASLWMLIYGIRALVIGPRAYYLYAGGLVCGGRGQPRAASWSDVLRLEPVYNRRSQGSEGKIMGYRVELKDGSNFALPLVLVDGRDAFIDRVVDCLRSPGRPIEGPVRSGRVMADDDNTVELALVRPSMPEYAGQPAPYHTVSAEQRKIWEQKGNRAIGFGLVWLLVGVLVSIITYANAAGGGVYIVAWGPALYGAYRIVSGVLLRNKSSKAATS